MNRELIIIGAMILMLTLTTTTSNLSAQNATTNASNAVGNMTASANQTASELGKNDTLQNVLNKTGEVGKKILGGAADVVSNISEEVKEGLGTNK